MSLRDAVFQEAQALSPQITSLRRKLHACPGTGFDLADTLTAVEAELRRLGYEPARCGRAGLVATLSGEQPGKVFLLRADMDGLPIREEAEVDFPSRNGKMHACGHDMHTAMLLGAAALLKTHQSQLRGTVKLMFQPAEEIFEGSADMIRAGVLNDPDVDAALMIHVMAGMPFPPGTVIVANPGVSAPAADYFEITVQGAGCHGSMPNTGVDPITAAAHILLALQELHARELALSDRAVLTVGTFHAGTAANAIPDTAVLGGSIRTFDEEVRGFLKRRLEEISRSVAAAFRAEAAVTFGSGCPTLVNDAALAEGIEGYLRELLGDKGVFSSAQLAALSGGNGSTKAAGSEDFAYVSHEVPSLMLALAAGQPEQGYPYPQHHPKVKFDEAALPVGSAVYAYAALRWLAEH